MNFSPKDFFKRKLGDPILAQLKQGTTPKNLALSCSLGLTLSLFPILGSTSLLCLGVGVALKLNHPTLQAVNYLMTPLQLLGIPIFLHVGESLFGLNHVSFNPMRLGKELTSNPGAFFSHYGSSALAGIFIWACIAPIIAFIIYKITFAIFHRTVKETSTSHQDTA
jgi:uncharacterized protein (DUF2062 family)